MSEREDILAVMYAGTRSPAPHLHTQERMASCQVWKDLLGTRAGAADGGQARASRREDSLWDRAHHALNSATRLVTHGSQ